MTVTNATERALLRSHPHYTKLHLSIYEPTTVLTAQVNDPSIAKNAKTITIDNKVGNDDDVRFQMMMLVGSTPGADDKGVGYVYNVSGTVMQVGENSHINWADNDYITILNYFHILPLYPTYEIVGEEVSVRKEFDRDYTNQNEILGSFICMGSHYAGFLENGQAQVYFTAEGTENVKGDSVTYLWTFEGGTPTGSTALTPGYVTWTQPGHYTVRLAVTSSSGAFDVGFRHISIYDKPGEGSNLPVLKWGLETLTGSRQEAGYTASIWVEDEGISLVKEGSLVVIFAEEDWYGDTKQSIGGNATGREKIVFVGYIQGNSIEYDYESGRMTFDVLSPTGVMKETGTFSVSLEDSTNPIADSNEKGLSPWFFLVGLTPKTAIHHYVRWHTSLNKCADIRWRANNPAIHFADFDRSSLYDAMNDFLYNTLLGGVFCDRQGALYIENQPEGLLNGESDYGLIMHLDKHDWIGRPAIEERFSNDLAYVEMGGVAYTVGVADEAFLSAAPGNAPAYRGRTDTHQGLSVTSQDNLNNIAGQYYAVKNARYPSFDVELAGNYRVFDIAPLERFTVSLGAGDTPRGLVWTQKSFSMDGLDLIYFPEQGSLRMRITGQEIVTGFAGDTIPIPPVPPATGFDQDPIEIPSIPSIPPFTIPPSTGGVSVQFIQAETRWVGTTTQNDARLFNQAAALALDHTVQDIQDIFGRGVYMGTSSNVEIYPVIIHRSTSALDIYINQNNAVVQECGGRQSDIASGSGYTGYYTVTSIGIGNRWECISPPISLSGISTGDLIHCRFQRDTTIDDSFTVGFAGWLVYGV